MRGVSVLELELLLGVEVLPLVLPEVDVSVEDPLVPLVDPVVPVVPVEPVEPELMLPLAVPEAEPVADVVSEVLPEVLVSVLLLRVEPSRVQPAKPSARAATAEMIVSFS